jgi:1,4-dihydroxy-2-naphthoate octaprenyltransferase
MSKGVFNNWISALRPKTLPAAMAPVIMGTAMAFGDGFFHLRSALLCLGGALAIQIATNLANDYYDFAKGADNENRVGPVRVTQAGLIKPIWVKLMFLFFFCIAAGISYLLVQRGGEPIAIIGILSILSGFFYTAGPAPLAYRGLGDIFVLIFFGPVAVGGTYYVQALEINYAILIAGLAPGLISVAILTVNNLRDIEGDKKAGKRTLAVKFGQSFAEAEYLTCIITAGIIPVILYLVMQDNEKILFTTLALLLAIPSIRLVINQPDKARLNAALGMTGRFLFVYSVIFAIGWNL